VVIPRNQFTEAERKERRIEIIEAAVREFAEHGYHGADVGKIAAEAGVAKGTIYNYFANKEDLFVGVVHSGMDQLVNQLAEIASGRGDPLARLRKAVLESLKFTERNLGIYQVMINEAVRSCPGAVTECGSMHKTVLDIIEDMIKQCIAAGQLSRSDPKALAVMLYGLVDGVTTHAVLTTNEFDIKRSHRVIMKVFLDGTRKR